MDARPTFHPNTSPKRTPWLIWLGGVGGGATGSDWECHRCGRQGVLPTGCSVTTLGKFVALLQKEHKDCREPPAGRTAQETALPETLSGGIRDTDAQA